MTAHAWETRQMEKTREDAVATVARLERALAEAEDELAYRRELFGEARAAVDANRRAMMSAHELGARTVHQPGRRLPDAEAVYAAVPHEAVAALQRALVEDPVLQDREREALNVASDLERRVHQVARTLEHWRLVAGTGSPSTGSPSSDSPTKRAPVGPTPEPEAEPAKAAATQWTAPEPSAAQSPASVSLTIRDRLAGLAERVATW